jgi:hypothetical protein
MVKPAPAVLPGEPVPLVDGVPRRRVAPVLAAVGQQQPHRGRGRVPEGRVGRGLREEGGARGVSVAGRGGVAAVQVGVAVVAEWELGRRTIRG